MDWDEHASTWDEDPVARTYSRAALDSLRAEAAWHGVALTGARICDFGCGTGLLTEQLSGKAARIDAIDSSPAMLEVVRAKIGRNGWAHVRALSALPPAGEAYDLIVCSSACAFLEDYPATARLLASRLRAGGLLVQWDWELDPDDAEPYGLSREEIREALTAAGLGAVRVGTAFHVPIDDATMTPLMGSGVRL